ncbi:hypothetical protein RRF57_002483 [Xylaria bambusicola]|uniref:Uncharacterized protein n=1 Tax=Xylaria bambusicola TaxID=326684 RepID=A0AAN7Z4I9_9PEZI
MRLVLSERGVSFQSFGTVERGSIKSAGRGRRADGKGKFASEMDGITSNGGWMMPGDEFGR